MGMPAFNFEIRVCLSCGLRYPLNEGHSFGTRCPDCLGETQIVLRQEVTEEKNREMKQEELNLSVLLDNIRSAWNVGAIFRSADGFGFDHAYLCGITPTPEQDAVQKTSLGAEDFVTWSYHKDAVKLVKGLKKEGWKIYAMEETEDANKVSRLANTNHKSVLIVGSEVTGVDPELLQLCDKVFFIPMRGQKKSFNVAVAFGIAAFALTNNIRGRS